MIDKSLKLIGDPVIDANGSIGVTITSNDTLVYNITVYNGTIGIYVYNPSYFIKNVTLVDCNAYNNSQYGMFFYMVNDSGIKGNCSIHNNGNGTFFWIGSNLFINGNISVYNSSNNGVYFSMVNEGNITGKVHVYNNSINGIYFYAVFNTTINGSGVYIYNNGFEGSGTTGAGILLENSNYNFIDGIKCSNNTYSEIHLYYSNGNTINHTILQNDTKYDGIWLEHSNSNRITNNTIRWNAYDGIYLDFFSSFNLIYNNTIYENGKEGEEGGISIHDASNNIIRKNKIYDNWNNGINLWGENNSGGGGGDNNIIVENDIHSHDIGIYIGDGCLNTTIIYNNIYNNADYGILSNVTVPALFNYWGDETGPYNATSHPEGKGDNITANIIYSPWLGYSWPSSPMMYCTNDVIQYAIFAAKDGDIVKVYPSVFGVYRENVIINKSIILTGDPAIDAMGGIGISILANDTLVENFIIYNGSIGIAIGDINLSLGQILHNITLRNITLYSNTNAINNSTIVTLLSLINTSIASAGMDLLVRGVNYLNISDVAITNNGSWGALLWGVENLTLNNSYIHNNTQGLYLFWVNNSEVYNNTFGSNYAWAVTAILSRNISFINNTFSQINPTKASFDYNGNISVNGVDYPPWPPAGYGGVGQYINILADSWVNLSMYYNESVNGRFLKIWKFNGIWIEDGWNGTRYLDINKKIIGVNITNVGDPIFAPLIDSSPPVTTVHLGEPSYGNYITSYTPINITAYDNISGVNHTYYRLWWLNGSVWENITGIVEYGGNFSFADYGHLQECEHRIEYWSVDIVGNVEEHKNMTVYIDNTPPNAYIYYSGQSYLDKYVRSDTTIIIIADDRGECPVNVTYILYNIWNGSAHHWATWQKADGDTAYVEPLPADEGEYWLEYIVSDALGNNQSYNKSFWIDNSPPVSTMTPDNNSYVSASTYLEISAQDMPPGEGAAGGITTRYRIWNGSWQEWQTYDPFTKFRFTEACIHYVEFYSYDALGNTEETHNYTFYVDTTPPSTNIDAGNPNAGAGENKYFVTTHTPIWLNATDAGCNGGAGVAELHYTIIYNGYPYEFVVYDNEEGDWDNAIGSISVNISFNEECNHTLIYWAVDYVGNVELQNTTYFYVDDTPPIINLTIGSPQYNKDAKLFINFSTPIWVNATDDGLTEECTVSSVELYVEVWNAEYGYMIWEGPLYDYVDDGWASIYFNIDEECEHWINITAIDNLGNTAYYNYTVYVDNSPPVITKEIGEPKYIMEFFMLEDGFDFGIPVYITSSTPIYLNITDDGTEPCIVGSLHVRVGIWCNGEWNYTWYNVTDSPLNLTVYLPGECVHYLNITMYDDLGNVAYDNETFYVDNSNPVSNIDAIIPYCQEVNETNPLRINASVYDLPEICASGIQKVELYYRYAPYNHSFGNWTYFGNALYDEINDKWYWQFTAPKGPGYYQFYSIAYDNLGHKENVTAMEENLCVKLNMTIQLHQGWNLITIPIKTNWTAYDLGTNISGCTLVVKWDTSLQKYIAHYVPWETINNFDIKPGEGYWIYVEQDTELRIVGCLIEEINVTLYPELNLLGWANLDDTNMSAVVNEGKGISGVSYGDMVAVWNSSLQDWAIQIIGIPQMPDDKAYELTIGEAFFVYRSDGTAYWNGGRDF